MVYTTVLTLACGDIVINRKGNDEASNTVGLEGCGPIGRPSEGMESCQCPPFANTLAAKPGEETKCLPLAGNFSFLF